MLTERGKQLQLQDVLLRELKSNQELLEREIRIVNECPDAMSEHLTSYFNAQYKLQKDSLDGVRDFLLAEVENIKDAIAKVNNLADLSKQLREKKQQQS